MRSIHHRTTVRRLTIWLSVVAISGVYATTTCSLCGEYPIPDEGLLQEKNGIRCRDLYSVTTKVEEGTAECNNTQLAAFQTGCCSDEFIPKNVCTVCPDGSPYRTSMEIPGAANRRELTCADIGSEPSFLDFFTTPGSCNDTFLQRSAAWCQCPGQQVECHLCPNGAPPSDLEKTEHVLYGWNCRSFQYITALLNIGECAVASQVLEFDAAAFCCEGVEPPNVCDFCPSGQEVVDPDKTISSEYGFVRCGDIEQSLQMVPTNDSCTLIKKSFPIEMCCGIPGSSAVMATSAHAALSIMSITVLSVVSNLLSS